MAGYGEILELLDKPELKPTAIGGYDKASVNDLIARLAELVKSAEESCRKEKEIISAKSRGAASVVENIERTYKANLLKVKSESDALREQNRLLSEEIEELHAESEEWERQVRDGAAEGLYPPEFASAEAYIASLKRENERLSTSVKDAATLIETYETQYGTRLRRAEERFRELERELADRRRGRNPEELDAMIRTVEEILDKRDAILSAARARAAEITGAAEAKVRPAAPRESTASSCSALNGEYGGSRQRRAVAKHIC